MFGPRADILRTLGLGLTGMSLGLACGPAPISFIDQPEVETPEPPGPEMSDAFLVHESHDRKIDILFVVDNSETTSVMQSMLTRTLFDFHGDFEGADYRVAFTSAQAAHPACEYQHGIPGGFTTESCLDRPQAFSRDGMDSFNEACTANCDLSSDELQTTPTKIEGSAQQRPRPWLEFSARRSNLADEDVEMGEALTCLAPPGTTGCSYSSPLEAMYQALRASEDPERPEFGFLRKDASLFVVFLTTQIDCSVNPELSGADDAFGPDNATFWSTSTSGPTPAICWNAGVGCVESETEGFADCKPVQHNLAGTPIEADDPTAVLAPIQRYTDLLDELAAERSDLRADRAAVTVAIFAGIESFGEEPQYPTDQSGPWFTRFGSSPGCRSDWLIQDIESPEPKRIEATPPVRLRELAQRYPNVDAYDTVVAEYSICGTSGTALVEDGYANDLYDLSTSFAPYSDATICFPACASDSDPETPWVEARCHVTRRAQGEVHDVPECRRVTVDDEDHGPYEEYATDDDWQYILPDDDVDACVVIQGDAGSFAYPATSLDQSDDLQAECGDEGFNLSFELQIRTGVHLPRHTRFYASCELSPDASSTCPYIQISEENP